MLRYLPGLISAIPVIGGRHPNGLVATSQTTKNRYYLIPGRHGWNPLYHNRPDDKVCHPVEYDWMEVDKELKGKSAAYFSVIQVGESATKVYQADLYTGSKGIAGGGYGQYFRTVTLDSVAWNEGGIQRRLSDNVEEGVLAELDKMAASPKVVWTTLPGVSPSRKVRGGTYTGTTADGTKVSLHKPGRGKKNEWFINDDKAKDRYSIEWFSEDGVIFVRLCPCGGGKVSVVVLKNTDEKGTPSEGKPIEWKPTEWKM
ncbi:hypothetical protein FOL47_010283 [Perkinsus chesapeaki]|uniref:Uncharacterized protein n=1 Tax=Perkinsus chesapeaki TaxID=330153 RepID=A0A7J6L485_PERCH|nr:hypothetical protein FOL47_010283 [Perkinsus chesapeaki]